MNYKKTKSKVLSVLLMVCMISSMISYPVYASELNDDTKTVDESEMYVDTSKESSTTEEETPDIETQTSQSELTAAQQKFVDVVSALNKEELLILAKNYMASPEDETAYNAFFEKNDAVEGLDTSALEQYEALSVEEKNGVADSYQILEDIRQSIAEVLNSTVSDPVATYENGVFDENGLNAEGNPQPPEYQYADGGYQIKNAGNLLWFAQMCNLKNGEPTWDGTKAWSYAEARLVNNIDMSAVCHPGTEGVAELNWTPIGKYTGLTSNYYGTFDGQGYAISNLYCNMPSEDYIGLFGYIRSENSNGTGLIKNVVLKDATLVGKDRVGGICGGYEGKGGIENCMVVGGTIQAVKSVGGITGFLGNTMKNCLNSANISGTGFGDGGFGVGGIAGQVDYTNEMTNCINIGEVKGRGESYAKCVGGILGVNLSDYKATVNQCYYQQGVTYYNNKLYDNGADSSALSSGSTIESITDDQVKNGAAAYKLNGDQTDIVWYQNIDNGSVDAFPVLDKSHGVVYESEGKYSNTGTSSIQYENGFNETYGYQKPQQDENNVYLIENGGNLYWLAEQVATGNNTINAKLTANITVNADVLANGVLNTDTAKVSSFRSWTMIGTSSKEYKGVFDGDGHTISGLYYSGEEENVGLFGWVDGTDAKPAVIKNLGIVDSYFESTNATANVGGIAGWLLSDGAAINCYNKSQVIAKAGNNNITSTGDVRKNSDAGGIAGANSGIIHKCYNEGRISSSNYAGGLSGVNCRVMYASAGMGDVIGENTSSSGSTTSSATRVSLGCIEYSYNVGEISGVDGSATSVAGGIVGYNARHIKSCYSTGVVSGLSLGGVYGDGGTDSTVVSVTDTYYLSDSTADEFAKTTEAFNKGEVTWLLNDSKSTPAEGGTLAWGQTLSGDKAEVYPVLGGAVVYQVNKYESCIVSETSTLGYSNTNESIFGPHTYDEPAFTWTENRENGGYDCTVKRICTNDSAHVEEQPCTVTSATQPAASGKPEKIIYTAKVTIDNKEDTDIKEVVVTYEVTVTSKDTNGGVVNAALTGGGLHGSGLSVTVTAPKDDPTGYKFLGWYNADTTSAVGYAGDCLSTEKSYAFTISKNENLVAVYKAMGSVSITFDGGKSEYSVNGSSASTSQTKSFTVGTQITLSVMNADDFDYWRNASNVIVSRNPEYTFKAVINDTLTAVYKTTAEGNMIVVWETDSDQVLQRAEYNEGTLKSAQAPDLPVRLGYNVTGWDKDVKDLTFKSGTMVTIKPVSELINQTYQISIKNGTLDKADGKYNVSTVAKAVADDAATGQKFSHWEDGDKNILSYSSTYAFYVTKDISLTAVFVANEEKVDAVGTADIIQTSYDAENEKLSFVSMLTIPSDCTINYAGIVATSDAKAAENLTKNNAAYVRGITNPGTQTYRLTWTKSKVENGDTWYARAYLVYTTAAGDTVEIYGMLETITAGK